MSFGACHAFIIVITSGCTHIYNISNHSWITGGTTIASAFSYVDGKALTASGNKIRDSVRDRAKRRRQARK